MTRFEKIRAPLSCSLFLTVALSLSGINRCEEDYVLGDKTNVGGSSSGSSSSSSGSSSSGSNSSSGVKASFVENISAFQTETISSDNTSRETFSTYNTIEEEEQESEEQDSPSSSSSDSTTSTYPFNVAPSYSEATTIAVDSPATGNLKDANLTDCLKMTSNFSPIVLEEILFHSNKVLDPNTTYLFGGDPTNPGRDVSVELCTLLSGFTPTDESNLLGEILDYLLVDRELFLQSLESRLQQ